MIAPTIKGSIKKLLISKMLFNSFMRGKKYFAVTSCPGGVNRFLNPNKASIMLMQTKARKISKQIFLSFVEDYKLYKYKKKSLLRRTMQHE